MKYYRVLDANINRLSEGIRVIEDIHRFVISDNRITEKCRDIRHGIREIFKEIDEELIRARDSITDIGIEISKEAKNDMRENLNEIITANFKRAEEAARVIEETSKLIGLYALGKKIEVIRFKIYNLEKEVFLQTENKIPTGIYGITAEKYSNGKKNIDVIKEMISGGIKIIQYREKDKTLAEKLVECREISQLAKKYGVKFIVNDHIDIALLTDADGVHLGQDDIEIKEARKLMGNKIIGISTHSPEQAQKAIQEGADYIGVGPIFATKTKVDVCDPVGLEYLEYAVENVDIPFIAIGGIKENNISEVISRGAKRISLVTEIVGAKDITGTISNIQNMMEDK